ncbi:MAG: peptidylprolyl isomerase [Actinobacteria bacterium]|nr:peptidylprolyl isomerase [Actinomycetota bacterium]
MAGATSVTLNTNKGSFTISLSPDQAPIAAANFVALTRCGFYDGISFHRVLAGFVAQAGDPQTRQNRGDFPQLGQGGPGYQFTVEPVPSGLSYERYVAAMANSGQPDSNGSQFFIVLADLPGYPPAFTIFGRVTQGTDVIDAIARVPVADPNVGLPLDPVIIESATIGSAPSASP